VLLQVLDDGRLTDSQGRVVDFKNTIIIMTSNLASDVILGADTNAKLDALRPQIEAILKAAFRPEFLNRIDEIITFSRLERSAIMGIVRNQLMSVEARLKDSRLTLDVDEGALEFLVDTGYDPLFGARPVKRAIQSYLENPLAREILAGHFPDGSVIHVRKGDGGLVFSV
jgi:ATP-dependent Clp protease ATP-binding subunit ClpB